MPRRDDTLIVFDVNLRQGFYTKETLCDSMTRCNILKINDEELVAVSRMFGYPGIDLQDKCWILLGKYNLRMLILTCGINGSYVFTPGHVSFRPTPKVEVADTVGDRRLVYGRLHSQPPQREIGGRGPRQGSGDLGFRLHTQRSHADAPRQPHRLTPSGYL